MDHSRKRKMAAPGDDELLAAVLQVKQANPDFGMARVRSHLKETNGWELSEKRVKRAIAELADGKKPADAPELSEGAASAGTGTGIGGSSSADEVAGSWTVEKPSPRGYFSLTVAQPADGAPAGVVLFGGEFFDNAKNLFYNQLYRFDLASRGWSRFTSGTGPPARSAHQACICAGYYWVFGGEFSSPNGSKFKLMDDLWRMELSEDGSMNGGKWQRVGAGGGGVDTPGPRSGHRMVAVGDKLVIYGGMGESKYYGDLHVWDVTKGAWISKMVKMQQMKLGKDAKSPGPRGGFTMWPDGDSALYIYGGTRDKGRDESEYLDDLWRLDLTTWAWERVTPAAGTGPGVRSGPAVAVVGAGKRSVVLFGGVTDVLDAGAGPKSKPKQVFLSDMHCYHMDSKTWSIPTGAGADSALAASSAPATTTMSGSKPKCPCTRRNAQAGFLPTSSSLLLVGGLRDEPTQGGSKEKEVTLDDVWEAKIECSADGAVVVEEWTCLQAPSASDWQDSSDGEDGEEDERDAGGE